MSEQPGRYRRSAAGMIGALLVLLAVVAGFVLFRGATRNDPPSAVQPVDYRQTLKYARAQADFKLVAPPHLPRGWTATSVSFTDGADQHWHLGQLTVRDRYVGLEQGDLPVRSMVQAYVDPDPSRGKDVMIDGQPWTSWSDAGGDRALVRDMGRVTTLVVGTVERQVLVDYVKRLR